jgi:small subunit ribosomal protein S17
MTQEIRKQGREIGAGIPIPPRPAVADDNDPFYGSLRARPTSIVGHVVSAKAAKSAVVVVERTIFNKKYQRYLKARSKYLVHNPTSINAQEGDLVRLFATRPLSKTKHHVIVQVLGKFVEIKGQDLAKEAKDEKSSKHKEEEEE